MKSLKFMLGLFLGILIGISLFYIASCKSEQIVPLPQTSTKLNQGDGFHYEAYKMNVDNNQYLVVVNIREGGIAIIKHQ
jgi:hypothetical protein